MVLVLVLAGDTHHDKILWKAESTAALAVAPQMNHLDLQGSLLGCYRARIDDPGMWKGLAPFARRHANRFVAGVVAACIDGFSRSDVQDPILWKNLSTALLRSPRRISSFSLEQCVFGLIHTHTGGARLWTALAEAASKRTGDVIEAAVHSCCEALEEIARRH